MQIHELPAQTTAADADVFAVDNGTSTQKITVANLGKKVAEDATPAFTSEDASTASAWTSVNVLASGEAFTSILNKVSAMFKNIRYLYKLLGSTSISGSGKSTVTAAIGNTSIASLGNGTITGALNAVGISLTQLTITRTENSLVDAVSFARMTAYKRSNILSLEGNLGINFSGNTSFTEIGRISGWNAANAVLQNVPFQGNGAKIALIQITAAGVISVFTETGAANGFFRFNLCVPCA